jgi:MFS family permease
MNAVKNTGLFTIIMALATFVVVIDNTIMNVSINALVADLNTTVSGVQAAISLNALTMAAFVLMGGKLADIIGIKKTFMWGSIIYIAGSLLASFSHTLGVFILGWCAIQGLGAALMLPNVQTAIRAYLSGEARAKSYGIMGGVNSLGIAIGPILGGFLTTYYSWRWAFRIEVLTLVVMLFMSNVIPQDIKNENPPKLDKMGVFLQACAMVLLVLGVLLIGDYGLFFAKQPMMLGNVNLAFFGLSPALYTMMYGVIFLMLFIDWERKLEGRGGDTLLKLKLFTNKIFSKSLQIASIQTMMVAGLLFTVPLFLQVTFGLNPLQTGLYLLPLSVSVLIFALIGVRLKSRMSARNIMMLGWLIVILSALVLLKQMGVSATPNDLILGIAIFGVGMGLLASQTANVVMSSVNKVESAEASGTLNTFQQVGNSVGVAILGTILSVALVTHISTGIQQSPVIPPEDKIVIEDKLQQGVEVASTEYVEQVAEVKRTPENTAEIDSVIDIYSMARTKAFQATTVTLGFFALIALLMTRGIPKDMVVKEEDE